MTWANGLNWGLAGLHVLVQAALVMRILLRPHREPASRIAWVAVVVAMPIMGIFAYLLLGETSIGRKLSERDKRVLARLPKVRDTPGMDHPELQARLTDRDASVFRVAGSINGFEAVGGNSARIMADSNASIGSMVSDIDNATDHVHLVFYIWLTDRNGQRMADALIRAARRGVACRVLVDDLGSRDLVKSKLWTEMRAAGVRLATSLKIGSVLLKPLHGRIDRRDHRKILVIDDSITYCGSQNCADPEFLVKARFAPWVDIVFRFEGPVARQNQFLFARDWMTQVDDDIDQILRRPLTHFAPGFTAMAFGTGPTVRNSAMPEVFETLLYSARREIVATTPYYVPTEAIQSALCTAARRGVSTTIIFPARNDSWIVGAASRSYYHDLLEAGVKIHEYVGGLLHAKTLAIDGEISLVGSANMDRRSFDLNYENNILVADAAFTSMLRARQDEFLQTTTIVDRATVDAWSVPMRLRNNAVAMLGPVL